MTKVIPITPIEISSDEVTNHNHDHNDSSRAIELEMVKHEIKADIRLKTFEDILSNSPNQISVPKYLLYGVISVVITWISISPFSLIPVHNIILYPNYWYEFPLQMCGYGPLLAAFIILHCSYWMNIDYIKKTRHFFIMWLIAYVGMTILYPTGYIIWTHALHYQYPIPFNGYMYWYTIIICLYVTWWFRFPVDWRNNEAFRKRLKYFLIAVLCNQMITLQYSIISKVLIMFQKKYQWAIAMFLPFIREINIWLMTKLASKASCGDKASVAITSAFNIGTRHSLFLSYVLASVATLTSSIVIFSLDFIINLSMCLRIVWLHKIRPEKKDIIISLIQDLAIAEMLEMIVPLVYLLCFSTAYYGPNSELLGNIGNGYWQYNSVEDVDYAIKMVCLFFSIDLFSGLMSYIILWISSRINLLKAYIALQKEFGVIFLITFVFVLTTVSIK